MNARSKLALVFASVTGVLLATGIGYAYPQSITQQSSQTNCGSKDNMRGMGMMGGMNHYGTMNQNHCGTQMGLHDMGQCRGTALDSLTGSCPMFLAPNTTQL